MRSKRMYPCSQNRAKIDDFIAIDRPTNRALNRDKIAAINDFSILQQIIFFKLVETCQIFLEIVPFEIYQRAEATGASHIICFRLISEV